MENESLTSLKKQYVAAMSSEMKSPLKKIIGILSDTENPTPERATEIKDAARYLLSLVDELSEFARFKP